MKKKKNNFGPSNAEYYYIILKSGAVKPYTKSVYRDYWKALYVIFVIIGAVAGFVLGYFFSEEDEPLKSVWGFIAMGMMGFLIGGAAWVLGAFFFPKFPDFTDTRYRKAMKKLFPNTPPYDTGCYETDLWVANLYFRKLLDRDDRKTLRDARAVIFKEERYIPEKAEAYMRELNRIRGKHGEVQIPIKKLDHGRAEREQKKKNADYDFVMRCVKNSLALGQELTDVGCEDFYKTLKSYKVSENSGEEPLYDSETEYIDSAFLTYLVSKYIVTEHTVSEKTSPEEVKSSNDDQAFIDEFREAMKESLQGAGSHDSGARCSPPEPERKSRIRRQPQDEWLLLLSLQDDDCDDEDDEDTDSDDIDYDNNDDIDWEDDEQEGKVYHEDRIEAEEAEYVLMNDVDDLIERFWDL